MNTEIIWEAWMGGLAIGLYIIIQQWGTSKPLGCSTPFGNACALVSKKSFFKSKTFTSASASTNLWFLAGILLGGFIAAYSGNGSWSMPVSLDMGKHYDAFLPDVLWVKAIVLVFGGLLIGLGARLANGCASGHSMAGISMLNPISIFATILFFTGGLIVVNLLNYFFL